MRTTLKRIICCIAIIIVAFSSINTFAQINPKYLTDAYQDDIVTVPCVCVTKTYTVTKKFGEWVTNDEFQEEIAIYSKEGFLEDFKITTNKTNYNYKESKHSTYDYIFNDDGTIKVRKEYKDKTKNLVELAKYYYTPNQITILTYYGDGSDKDSIVFKNNKKLTYTGEDFSKLESQINYTPMGKLDSSYSEKRQYNKDNLLISSNNGTIEYKDYVFDADGNWIKRTLCLKGKPTEIQERVFYTQEEWNLHKIHETYVYAQEEVDPEQKLIFSVVEQSAEFPGGMEALGKYLSKNLKYPPQAKEQGIQGRVYVTFVVERDGSITDIKVLRDIGYGCGEEAVRVIKAMPKWKPAKQRGKAVRQTQNLPINFQLQ